MFKNEATISSDRENAQKLIGKYIKGPDDTIGKIIGAEPKYNSCEISIDFSDGIRVLDNKFPLEYWIEKSFDQDQLIDIEKRQFRKRLIISNKK
jgi:hypothetical protein